MRTVSVLFLLAFSFVAFPAHAFNTQYDPGSAGAGAPELHINRDATMSLKSGLVDNIVGNTLYLETKWGTMQMRFTMKTDTSTKVVKRYGGTATVAQISVGDYLDAEGDFIVGSDFFGLDAQKIKDWSLQEESETFSGKIIEQHPDGTLTLQTPLKAVVLAPATTTSVRKGSIFIPWSRLMKGDSIVLASGVYDYANNRLTADELVVFQPKTPFAARNYEGVLKKVEGTALPAALIVTVDDAEYRVELSAASKVMKKNRGKAEIGRFIIGDRVRFYGALREEPYTLRDERIVDATVVRNLNL